MRYVVVGASAAGINGARTLREYNKDAEIILVSKIQIKSILECVMKMNIKKMERIK